MHQRDQRGFTLVEMAFVIIVIGLIVASIMPLIFSSIKKDKSKMAFKTVLNAREEILGDAMMSCNGSPSSCLLPEAENAPDSICSYNCTIPGSSSNSNSSIANIKDPWGQSLIYFVAYSSEGNASLNNATGTIKPICKFAPSTNSTTLSVELYDGTIKHNVAFIILSRGPNHRLDSFFYKGSNATDVVSYDEYVSSNGTMNATLKLRYDDLVRFVVLDRLKERMQCE